MRSRSDLARWPGKQPLPKVAREAMVQIRQILERGSTAEQVAQARAALDAMDDQPRQSQLALKV